MSTATETVSQFDFECERNREISQNVQKLGFLQEKMGFSKMNLEVFENGNLKLIWTEIGSFLKSFEEVELLYKNRKVFGITLNFFEKN